MPKIWDNTDAQYAAIGAVWQERDRQKALLEDGLIHVDMASIEIAQGDKLAILVEEVGEVAKALNEGVTIKELRAELVQVAAVAVAWVESLHPPNVRPTSLTIS